MPRADPGPHAVLDVGDSAATLVGAAGQVETGLLESAVRLSRGSLIVRRRGDGAMLSLYLPLANGAA